MIFSRFCSFPVDSIACHLAQFYQYTIQYTCCNTIFSWQSKQMIVIRCTLYTLWRSTRQIKIKHFYAPSFYSFNVKNKWFTSAMHGLITRCSFRSALYYFIIIFNLTNKWAVGWVDQCTRGRSIGKLSYRETDGISRSKWRISDWPTRGHRWLGLFFPFPLAVCKVSFARMRGGHVRAAAAAVAAAAAGL